MPAMHSTTHLLRRRLLSRQLKAYTPSQHRHSSASSSPWIYQSQSQKSIPASYYRGGTSRALIIHASHLPPDKSLWAPIFRGVLGSPDPKYGRQLDGMGGGISSLSKIVVVGPSGRRDADVEYTFVQVGIKDGRVDYAGNCGNMTSAVGPWAVDHGVVSAPAYPDDDGDDAGGGGGRLATIRLYNTNTDKIVHATFPVRERVRNIDDTTSTTTASMSMPSLETIYTGPFTIDGVSGTASRIQLDFLDPAGSKTGSLLPTGSVVDIIRLPPSPQHTTSMEIRATCIDVGNPCIFVSAKDLGFDTRRGSDDALPLPDETSNIPDLLAKLELIRRMASVKMGLAPDERSVAPSVPKICFVSPPKSSSTPPRTTRNGDSGDSDSDSDSGGGVDVDVRCISTQQPHKALPITVGLAVSAAARLKGSIVEECLRPCSSITSSSSSSSSQSSEGSKVIVIGHPSGKLVVGAKYSHPDPDTGGGTVLESGTVYRTARRLMEGVVFWR